MRPTRARLSGWTRARIRAKEQYSARTRLAQRPADRLAPLERARALLRDRLSLHLTAEAAQPDAPERTRLHGLWWLPVVGTAAERQSLRTLADVWSAAPRRVDAAAVRALEAAAAGTAVAVLVSAHGFRRAGIQRALRSETPFLLLHLPTDDRALPAAGPVARTVKVDSALDLDYACGAYVANETLKALLGGRLHIGWDRIADEPQAMGASEEPQTEGRRTVLRYLSTRSVPTLYWAGIRLPDVDTAKKSSSFAKRLEERQKALKLQQEQEEAEYNQQHADVDGQEADADPEEAAVDPQGADYGSQGDTYPQEAASDPQEADYDQQADYYQQDVDSVDADGVETVSDPRQADYDPQQADLDPHEGGYAHEGNGDYVREGSEDYVHEEDDEYVHEDDEYVDEEHDIRSG